jgi:LAO/AO transport system kinase
MAGSKLALAKAITLSESTRVDHREIIEKVLEIVSQKAPMSIRVGVSGSPGVGKSTFIDAFGRMVLSKGKKLAVLTIDPSSPVHGGSILGDKTRMINLVSDQHAFIRPSPSSGELGGVGSRTREAVMLCEAAGYDFVIVETVGVGQSDLVVSSMTDIFLQLHMPLSGDDLQGMKKGSNEIADFIIITKADGVLKEAAQIAKMELEHSFHSDKEKVFLVSAKDNKGISEVCDIVFNYWDEMQTNGRLIEKRREQVANWVDAEFKREVIHRLYNNQEFNKNLKSVTEEVVAGSKSTAFAVRTLLSKFLK